MPPEPAMQSQESDRHGDGDTIRNDPKLVADGWVRRHLVDPQRARESMALYASLGYEVRAEKLTADDFGPQCRLCASEICRSYVLIYTRKIEPKD